jgi:hypothetical protein
VYLKNSGDCVETNRLVHLFTTLFFGWTIFLKAPDDRTALPQSFSSNAHTFSIRIKPIKYLLLQVFVILHCAILAILRQLRNRKDSLQIGTFLDFEIPLLINVKINPLTKLTWKI